VKPTARQRMSQSRITALFEGVQPRPGLREITERGSTVSPAPSKYAADHNNTTATPSGNAPASQVVTEPRSQMSSYPGGPLERAEPSQMRDISSN
jgi:hypothetical protein